MRALLRAGLLSLGCIALWVPPVRLVAQTPPLLYDLFVLSDSGSVSLWINTETGDFRWVDRWKKIDFSARGTLSFPNLGPMVLSYSGEASGYDWAILALKLYGTSATGSLTLFPAGERVHKVVSLFWDRDTRNDTSRNGKRRQTPPPSVGEIRTGPKPEIPSP